MNARRHVRVGFTRRRFAVRGFVVLCACGAGMTDAAPNYVETVAALTQARDKEMRTYYRYMDFARQARAEGYLGIAYLFTAFASSELIHAQNFGRILSRQGVELLPLTKEATNAPTATRDNLLAAVDSELESIDRLYPALLERLKPEAHADAIATVRHAWASEKQHRDIIQKIRRWSPSFFEQVARSIDEKTGAYFVCQLCGSTTHAVPRDKCPVCAMPPLHYRRIEPPV
jgi:rubrerythrin